MTNKEVRVTFRGIDKTREAFGRIRQNFKKLQELTSKLSFGFGRIGTAIAAAFSTHALKKIIDSGEQIGKLSAKLDMSTRSLSELKYVASNCGVEFDSLTSGLTVMAARINEAAKGSGEAKQALQALGLSAKELASLSPDQQLEKIASQFERLTDSTDKATVAAKLFGSESSTLTGVLEQGAVGIQRMREEAQKLGVSLSEEDCTAMAQFNSELNKLQTVLISLITSCLVPILPLVTSFFEAMREGRPAITFIITAITTILGLKLAAWFITTAAAVRTFTVALTANPLALTAIAITGTVAGLVTLTKWFNKSSEAAEKHNKALESPRVIETLKLNLPKKEEMAVMSKSNEMLGDARQIFEQTRTPLEKHNAQIEKLNKLLKQGLIDQETYNRALKQSEEQLDRFGEHSKDVFDLITEKSKDGANNLIDNFADAAFGAGGHIKSLKETCSDFFKELQSDILKMTLKEDIIGTSSKGGMLGRLFGSSNKSGNGSGFLSGLGSTFGGFFAKGGTARPGKAHIVGDGGEPELFIPHSIGSIVPFSNLETTGASGGNIVVNMNIQTPDIASFNQSRNQITADMARQISRSKRNL
ncbi:hypothetical protein [Rickettsia endosymbiont of Polydrusus tereticollis]|uniref:hypothetical protein n=1 Tax=Rickettsia endosymbiont of Polydrusus tereticollis TaxID=3066251 RepID=UPI0031332AC5